MGGGGEPLTEGELVDFAHGGAALRVHLDELVCALAPLLTLRIILSAAAAASIATATGPAQACALVAQEPRHPLGP